MSKTTDEKIDEARTKFVEMFPPGIAELRGQLMIFYHYALFELKLNEDYASQYARLCIDHGEDHFDAAHFYIWFYHEQIEISNKN